MATSQERDERSIRLVVVVGSKVHGAAELTQMLGCVPDESWDVGAPFELGLGTKLRDTSAWVVEERTLEDEHCSAAADRLVARLQAIVPKFQALPTGVEVSLRILVDEEDGVFGLGLDKPHVAFAAAIGADLDVSVAVRMSIEDLERDLEAAKQAAERSL